MSLPVALDPRRFLEDLFREAVQRARPSLCLPPHLPTPPRGRTLVIGAGKAAGSMAHALDALWPAEAPMTGLVITRYGHTPARSAGTVSRIELIEASHPVPDEAGLAATQRILQMCRGLTANDLVICLMSGGGSALLTAPVEGFSLSEKRMLNDRLLKSGASISEMNCVRRHLSDVKGGRLAAACLPARVVTLAISDIPGDVPSVLASGPTVPDTSSPREAIEILHRYGIDVPEALARGNRPPVQLPQELVEFRWIATPRHSLEAAAAVASAQGIRAHILSDEIEGESRDVGKVHAALARSIRRAYTPFEAPCVLLSGGETTVTVRSNAKAGQGGRAGEFCLGLAQGLIAEEGIWGLAADTDGIDGAENNAGAIVTPDTLSRARAIGLSIDDHVLRNDSFGFFSRLNDLVVTGPTFTNVNDFRAVLVL